MWHIFSSKLSLAPDALIGICLIGVYFIWIIRMGLYRIKKGDHMRH